MVVVRLDESAARATTKSRRGDTVELPDGPHLRADEFAEGKSGGVGDGGRRRLAFDVVEAGRHELRVELARPWETTVRRSITFILHASDPS